MEIERKWLIDPASLTKEALENFGLGNFVTIYQCYLSTKPEIRLRKTVRRSPGRENNYQNDLYELTIKGSGTLSRFEKNIELTSEEFNSLVKDSLTMPIIKTRQKYYWLSDPKVCVELDTYIEPAALEEQMVAEIEFDSEEKANAFIPFPWFGKEVTEDPRYKNKSIAFNLCLK